MEGFLSIGSLFFRRGVAGRTQQRDESGTTAVFLAAIFLNSLGEGVGTVRVGI